MKHTKTPWHVNAITAGRIVGSATVKAEKYQINSANNTIATVYRSSDAEFLVRACNAHEALVAVATKISEFYAGTDAPIGILASEALKIAQGD